MKLFNTSTQAQPWKRLASKMPSMFFGFILFAAGILATIYADLGAAPWDVFHIGLSHHLPLSLGQVMQLTGVVLLIVAAALKEKPGLGSFFNMYFIGLFVDIIESTGIYFTPDHLLARFAMLILGVWLIGWGTFFYLKVQLGAGPRDGLMVGIVKYTRKPVWLVRGTLEFIVLLSGYFLGGPVGIGTVLIALTLGWSVQLAFKIGKYNARERKHKNIVELVKEFQSA